jgi:hypothetical protein
MTLFVTSAGKATSERAITAPPTGLMVAYDAATQRYSLQNNERSRQFGPSQLTKETSLPDLYPRVEYELRSAVDADFLVFFKSPSSNPMIQFSHAGHGAWQHNDTQAGGTRVRLDYFVYGAPTPAVSLPKMGIVQYRFFGTGNYASNDQLFIVDVPGTITVDFSAGTFVANVTPSGSNFFNGGVGGTTPFRIEGKIVQNGGGGSALFNAATWAGTYRLQFYGPQAQEVGVTYSAIGLDGAQAGAFIGVTP